MPSAESAKNPEPITEQTAPTAASVGTGAHFDSQTGQKPGVRIPKKGKKVSQERLMVALIAVFFLGVLIFSIMPEGMYRGIAMGLYSTLVYFALMKYCT